MAKFLELEGGYLVIGLVVLLVTLFVTTRPFFTKGAVKKGLFSVSLFLAIAIGLHYKVTTDRMSKVKNAFLNNQKILCESRATRKVAQFVTVDKQNEWNLEGDIFTSPNYSRAFHTARCIIK
jgi:hypothetical protein